MVCGYSSSPPPLANLAWHQVVVAPPHLEPAAIRRCVLTRVNITSPPSALPVIKFHSADGNHWGGGRAAAEFASNKWLQM